MTSTSGGSSTIRGEAYRLDARHGGIAGGRGVEAVPERGAVVQVKDRPLEPLHEGVEVWRTGRDPVHGDPQTPGGCRELALELRAPSTTTSFRTIPASA